MGDIFTDKDMESIAFFRREFPTWWFRIGWCDVSFDFTCAPQGHSPEALHIKKGNIFDYGFSFDSKESLSNAILECMGDIDYELSEREKTK